MGDRLQRIKAVKADWSDIVLVCRKCSKKLRGGFGPRGDKSLGKALDKEFSRSSSSADRKTRKRRRYSLLVLEVDCQDLCPKQAVVACRPGIPHRWLIVPKGMPISAVAAELGIARGEHPTGAPLPVLSPQEPASGAIDFSKGAPDAASFRVDR